MPPLIDQLILPPKIALRGLDVMRRFSDAAVVIANELTGLHGVLKPMSDDLDGLREAFEGSNRELAALREAMNPGLRGVRALEWVAVGAPREEHHGAARLAGGCRAAARGALESAPVDRLARRGPQ